MWSKKASRAPRRRDRPQYFKSKTCTSDYQAGKSGKAAKVFRLGNIPNAAQWYEFKVELRALIVLSITKGTEETALSFKSTRLHLCITPVEFKENRALFSYLNPSEKKKNKRLYETKRTKSQHF
jgi:hypothetical protein